jgi:sulfur carrier protein
MNVMLNGEQRQLADDTTAAELIRDLGAERGSAIAVDGVVVPRAEWAGFVLRDGQQVEVVTAVQGG